MESWALIDMSIAGAMQGASQRARAGTEQALPVLTELGLQMWIAGAKQPIARVLRYEDLDAAIDMARRGVGELQQLGETGLLSTSAAELAFFLLDAHTPELTDEAEHWVALSESIAAPDDVVTQGALCAAKARLAARRGSVADAERLARESVVIAERTEYGVLHRMAFEALAEVLETAGRFDEAAHVVEANLAELEARRDVVMTDRERGHLAELRERTASRA